MAKNFNAKLAVIATTLSTAILTVVPAHADVYGDVWDSTFSDTIQPMVQNLVFPLIEAVLAAMLLAQIVKAVREYRSSGEVNLGVIFIMGAAIALVWVMVGRGGPQLLWKFVHIQ